LWKVVLEFPNKKCIFGSKSGANSADSDLRLQLQVAFLQQVTDTEEASASEINTGIRLNNYSGITRQSLATTGFAARLV
jgi:hypothetical protein